MSLSGSTADMPIAIIGTAFRFPGDLATETDFWLALTEGRDLVTQIDPNRWCIERHLHTKPSEPGRSKTFSAGVLSGIDKFDAEFFGISPREAVWLDPQQRLLLELAWESLENAGITPATIAGTDCSVYIGISGVDYGMRGINDLASMSSHSMTGNTLSIAANRLSYVFDLHGPSVAVDTACSSSLIALHHACNSLRCGESPMAMVGGVNLLLHPYPFIGFTKASMLSATGRCRAFDASGNGYVRGEGGAILLLKPLKQALADGNRVEAVILASGANADGNRKTGLTIPSSQGQADLMRGVLKRAKLRPDDIDYIEAHGTGTAVGDPIEAAAIGEIYGKPRKKTGALPIGSVKTNLGHLEPASGMAGLIKTVLALQNRTLPPSLYFETPNPNIDFDGLKLEPVTQVRRLAKAPGKKLVMGVNSFGFGGANAHVLLQEYQPKSATLIGTAKHFPPLFLSARSTPALQQLAAEMAELVREKPSRYDDIAYAAAYQRERLSHRLVIHGEAAEPIAAKLAAFALGSSDAAISEHALAEPGSVAFIYTGNGSQWVGMGRQLIAQSPRFCQIINELDLAIQTEAGFSVTAQLHADAPDSKLADTAVAQPLLFALQVALTTLLQEGGIRPHAVTGHSVGEVAAAWAAGALTLAQAIQVICERSAAQSLTAGAGRMAAVGMSSEAATGLLAEQQLTGLEIAGINSPNNITVSGPLSQLQQLEACLVARGVFYHLLDLDYAFHSRAMDPIAPRLRQRLAKLKPGNQSNAAYVSSVTGEVLEGQALGADYWWHNVRKPVQFAAAVQNLAGLGCRVFIEIGPHAILQRYISESLAAHSISSRVLPTLRRGDDGLARVKELILRAHLLQEPASLSTFFPYVGSSIRLPNYPWQRERFWHPVSSESSSVLESPRIHPLLGWRVHNDFHWENVLDADLCPWLADHQVGSAVVLPASAYVELALAAAREHFGGKLQALEQLDIVTPVVFDGEHARVLRFELKQRDHSFTIRSRQRLSHDDWTLNAQGRLLGIPTDLNPDNCVCPSTNTQPDRVVDHATHYRLASRIGLDYGPSFQGLAGIAVFGDTLTAQLLLPDSIAAQSPNYLLHPAVLDLCFQSLITFFQESIELGQGKAFLPVKVGRITLVSEAPIASFRAILRRGGTRSAAADFDLFDSQQQLVASLQECRFRAVPLPTRGTLVPRRWQTLPSLKPLPFFQRSCHLPPIALLLQSLRAHFLQTETELRRASYLNDAAPLLEALAVAFLRKAFSQLPQPNSNTPQGPDSAACQTDMRIQLHWQWMLGVLQQEGQITQNDVGAWELCPTDLPEAQIIWRTLLRDYPGCLPELSLMSHMGQQLPALLSGQMPVEDIQPGIYHSQPFESLLADSHAYLGSRTAALYVLQHVASAWPAQRRLRILEVVSTPANLATQFAQQFKTLAFDYVLAVTDADACSHLQMQLSTWPEIRVVGLTANNLQLSDRSLPDRFDMLVLHHVLHLSDHPAGLLAGARQKLADSGLLLTLERHADVSADFIFGLQTGWWHAGQGNSVISRLVSHQTWRALLQDEGFVEIDTFTERATQDLSAGAYLVLAKAPADASAQLKVPKAHWLLLCDASAESALLAQNLSQQLQALGQDVQIADSIAFSQEDPASQETLLKSGLLPPGQANHIVFLSLAASSQPSDAGVITALHVVQALARTRLSSRLTLVCSGGALTNQPPRSTPVNMAAAALWGFGRAVMNEYPANPCTLIDLDLDPAVARTAELLAAELTQPDNETEVILSQKARWALRTSRYTPPLAPNNSDTPAYCLDFHTPGQLRNLVWMSQEPVDLAPDQVEVRVVATGLNFRDVMYVMGLLPDEAVESGFAGASLGLEFSGVVARIGNNSAGLSVGDPVMGFGPACFSSHVVTSAGALALKPPQWTFDAAATVPTAFFTAYYALSHLAKLQAGERVLIHGAAGGVGIAAMQLAIHLGAEIFATVGSDEKRHFVTLLGADHVFDSRSLDFADQILKLTGGEGVDVVLNSLSGEAIRRNLQVIKPFGRFLELGKRDFFENTTLGLRPFKNNLSYFGIDADQLLMKRPALAQQLFREVMALFRDGALFPLPHRVLPAGQVVDAFRAMQQSRHIGKLVVRMADSGVQAKPAYLQAPMQRFSAQSTWLITGGLSGFGLESACWLAERGVGHLLLLGRRGLATPGASEAVARLEALGAQVSVVACDVADQSALQTVLSDLQRSAHPPLHGILHAAMVIDDALIANLTAQRMNQVLAPKMLGAWHLHSLTIDLPIAHFVLYSSITTLFGNPGQANYVAANAALEGLANQRRAMGLPVSCIGWGPIEDVGYLTRNQAVKNSLTARLGAAPLTAAQALSMLDQLLTTDVSLANFSWSSLSKALPALQSARFESLRRRAGPTGESEADNPDFAALIADKSADEVLALVRELVTREVAQVLCITPERIDPGRSLHDLGMDSLMGVELALGLEKRFGIQLPVMMLNEGPTVARVASRIVDRVLGTDSPANEPDHIHTMVSQLASQHGEDVSAEDVAQTAQDARHAAQPLGKQ